MTNFDAINNRIGVYPLIHFSLAEQVFYFTTHLKFIQFVQIKERLLFDFQKNENQEGVYLVPSFMYCQFYVGTGNDQ